ncbi:MAG: aldo/keto reductase, partial [Candidatus Latescibacteria bacterium]|nr:aldo/keto reductase [Candidatus Latescibacterota bacterium]
HRVLGKTGEEVPILGYGSAPGGMGLSDEDAIALCHKVIDLGVTYIDTAPGYGRAHVQLGHVMAERRDKVFLVTKTAADEAEQVLKILEKALKDLQTDHVDLVYVHSMGHRDVDQVLGSDGRLDAICRDYRAQCSLEDRPRVAGGGYRCGDARYESRGSLYL